MVVLFGAGVWGPLIGAHCIEHRPLRYWLDYVRQASPGSPILVIENKCDDGKSSHPPCDLEGAHATSFSAKNDAGEDREHVLSLIRRLCRQELEKTGERMMGVGGRNVKRKIRNTLKQGKQTLSRKQFESLCEKEGEKVSSAEELLTFLLRRLD